MKRERDAASWRRIGGAVVATAVAAVAGVTPDAIAQRMLWYAESKIRGESFGLTDAGPDVDGDGVPDLLVTNSLEDCSVVDGGVVHLYSTSGGELNQWCGDGGWGAQAQWVDDVDSGGMPDFVVTQPAWYDPVTFGFQTGRVQLMSFETGAVIREWRGGQTDGDFGQVIDIIDDLDGDGLRDLVVGQPDYGVNAEGRIWLLSCGSGATIRVHDGSVAFGTLGLLVTAVRDVSGDGVEDYAASSSSTGFGLNRVDVYSGVDGSALAGLDFTGGELGGRAISPFVDLDGDLVPEILVGGYNASAGVGSVTAFSTASSQVVFRIEGEPNGDRFGTFGIVGLTDLDSDGYEEMLVTAIYDSTRGHNDGRVDVISGRFHRRLYSFFSPVGPIDNYGAIHAKGADFDGDGIEDFVIGGQGAQFKAKGGHVAIFAGNDLWLQAEPPDPAVGETVVVDLRGGEPNRLGLIALTNVDGSPTFEVFLVAPFDANGELQFTADIDPSVSGMQFTLMAWAENRKGRGKLMDATPFVVTAQ